VTDASEPIVPGLGGLSWDVTDRTNSKYESWGGIVVTEANLFVKWRNESSEGRDVTVVAETTSGGDPFVWTDRILTRDSVGVYVDVGERKLACGAKDLISVQPGE